MQARIENPAYLLKPGMFGRITLIAGTENVMLVPESALVDTMVCHKNLRHQAEWE